MKRRTLALLLTIATLLGLCACAAQQEASAPPTTTVETTEEPDVFVTNTIIQGGASDYVIVHDGTPVASNLANTLSTMLAGIYGVQLKVTSASQVQETDKQILVGKVGTAGERAMKKLTGEFDFLMKQEENKLILCAKNDLRALSHRHRLLYQPVCLIAPDLECKM